MPLSSNFAKNKAQAFVKGKAGKAGKVQGKTHPPTPMDQNGQGAQQPQEPDGDEQMPPGAPGTDGDGDEMGGGELQPHPHIDSVQAEAEKHGASMHPLAQLGGLDGKTAIQKLKQQGFTDIHGHTQNLDLKPIEDTPHHAAICTHCQNGEDAQEEGAGDGSEMDGGEGFGQNEAGGVPAASPRHAPND